MREEKANLLLELSKSYAKFWIAPTRIYWVNTMKNEVFMRNLKFLIETSKKQKQQIAKEIGVNPQRITDYLRGKSTPDPETITKLCKALNCNYEDLLGEIG